MNRQTADRRPHVAWQVETLAESARALAERGEISAAEDVYRQILETAPHHLKALSFLGMQAHKRGDHAGSTLYLEQAARAAPEQPLIHQNLGLAYRGAGEPEKALAALERATTLDPELRTAHLHKGALLESMGKTAEAVAAYWQAWRQFPPRELLARDTIAPPHLRLLAQHAAEQLRRTQAVLLEEALQPAHSRYGSAALARIKVAIEIYLGLRKPEYLHPLQRPSFIYLPGVTPRAFFDRREIPGLPGLEAATREIRAELEAVLGSTADLEPYVQIPAGQDPLQWRELNGSKQWSSLHILRSGAWVTENRKRCPRTAEALGSLSLPHIPEHAPEGLFSILLPDTHIPPHHGLGNYKLVAHLPLIVPGSCAIRVGDETRSWREGECLVFDDSFEHEAWNRSDSVRAVLILDVWNPLVTEAEREALTAMVGAIGAFRSAHCAVR